MPEKISSTLAWRRRLGFGTMLARRGENCSHFQLVKLWFANTKKGVIATGRVASRVRDNRLIADGDAVFLTFSISLSVTMRHLPVRRNAPLNQILAPADEENAQRTSPLYNRAKRKAHHAYHAQRTS